MLWMKVFHHLNDHKECKLSLHFQKALLMYFCDFFTSNAIVLYSVEVLLRGTRGTQCTSCRQQAKVLIN